MTTFLTIFYLTGAFGLMLMAVAAFRDRLTKTDRILIGLILIAGAVSSAIEAYKIVSEPAVQPVKSTTVLS